MGFISAQKSYSSNKTKTTSVGKNVEKRETFYAAGGNVNWCGHYGEQSGGSSKNKK